MEQYYLVHHGIQGQKWGVRRFQNDDGSLTSEGKKRYGYNDSDGSMKNEKKYNKERTKLEKQNYKKTSEGHKKESKKDVAKMFSLSAASGLASGAGTALYSYGATYAVGKAAVAGAALMSISSPLFYAAIPLGYTALYHVVAGMDAKNLEKEQNKIND